MDDLSKITVSLPVYFHDLYSSVRYSDEESLESCTLRILQNFALIRTMGSSSKEIIILSKNLSEFNIKIDIVNYSLNDCPIKMDISGDFLEIFLSLGFNIDYAGQTIINAFNTYKRLQQFLCTSKSLKFKDDEHIYKVYLL